MITDQMKNYLYNHELDKKLLYQPIEHPDFDDWEYQQPCVERWSMILPHIPRFGTVLDIGCHTGWFCRQFSRYGWKSIGVDTRKENIEVAKALDSFCGEYQPTYYVGDALSIDFPEVDVALCLSVLMYFFPSHGWMLLNKLKTKKLFLDFGGMYAHKMPTDFIDQLPQRTNFTKITLLGTTCLEDRPLYMVEK